MCYICNQFSHCVKCSKQDCALFMHVQCAFKVNLVFRNKEKLILC